MQFRPHSKKYEHKLTSTLNFKKLREYSQVSTCNYFPVTDGKGLRWEETGERTGNAKGRLLLCIADTFV